MPTRRRTMESTIDAFVKDFEQGKMTRRQLVKLVAGAAATMALVGRSTSAIAAESSTFTATGVNHIALNVPDIDVSRDFYVKHLGMEVSRQGSNNCFMNCGNNFVALFKSPTPGMNHYCYSVKNYDVRDAEEKLKAAGLKPRVAGNRIYFPDPHGLEVQLASDTHMP